VSSGTNVTQITDYYVLMMMMMMMMMRYDLIVTFNKTLL